MKSAQISSRQLREKVLLLNDKDEFRHAIAGLFFLHVWLWGVSLGVPVCSHCLVGTACLIEAVVRVAKRRVDDERYRLISAVVVIL